MSYLITMCEDISRNMKVDIMRSGNKYVVSLIAENRTAKKMFNDLHEAYELFQTMTYFFTFGLYSTNDRFEIFENGGVE